jgi:hypothetical protein
LSNEHIQQIKKWFDGEEPKNNEVKFCERCRHFVFGEADKKLIVKKCIPCEEKRKKYAKQRQIKKLQNKCKWFTGKGKPCGNSKTNGNYCKYHQYANEYTEEQRSNNCGSCSDCHLWINQDIYATCQKCRLRGEKYRQKEKKNIIKCKYDGCKFKTKKDGYCGNHQKEYWKIKQEEDRTKKVCGGYKRKCWTVLDINYKYSKCENCRMRERQSCKKRKNKVREENKDRNDNMKKCIVCSKIYNLDMFQGKNGEVEICSKDRDIMIECEKRRGPRNRDYRDYNSKP